MVARLSSRAWKVHGMMRLRITAEAHATRKRWREEQTVNEIIFIVEEDAEGGYTARAAWRIYFH